MLHVGIQYLDPFSLKALNVNKLVPDPPHNVLVSRKLYFVNTSLYLKPVLRSRNISKDPAPTPAPAPAPAPNKFLKIPCNYLFRLQYRYFFTWIMHVVPK